jgi:competence protein ComEA
MLRSGICAMLLAAAGLPVTAAPPSSVVAVPAEAAPGLPASHAASGAPLTISSLRHRPKVVEHYVDINSASRKELTTLPGIGPAEADRIVAHRPYLTKTELVTKEVLPIGPYLSLKDLVVAMPKLKPKGKA